MGTVAEKFQYLLETKNLMKQIILDSGGNVTDSDSFRSYVDKFGALLDNSDAPNFASVTATQQDVREGKMFYNNLGNLVEGVATFVSGGDWTVALAVPTNLRVDGDFLKWDAVNTDAYTQGSKSLTYYVKIDSNSWTTTSSTSYSIANLAEGLHTYQVYAKLTITLTGQSATASASIEKYIQINRPSITKLSYDETNFKVSVKFASVPNATRYVLTLSNGTQMEYANGDTELEFDMAFSVGEYTFTCQAFNDNNQYYTPSEISSRTYKYNPGVESPVYGVMWVNDTTTTMDRTDDAQNLDFYINSSSGIIQSDFDNVFPWNETEIVEVDGNKFKKFPDMWFRIDNDANGDINGIAVSKNEGSGGNWQNVTGFYYGCYGASVSSGKLKSVTGVGRQVNTTRAGFRNYAKANGTGYQQLDLYHHTVLLFLWWIEFAKKDSSTIMTGYTGSLRATGGTNAIASESGWNISTKQTKWHDIEDYFGNALEFVDGIVSGTAASQIYATNNPDGFTDTNAANTMSKLSYQLTSTGSITAFGWDADNPFLVYPSKTTSTDYSKGFCDYGEAPSTNYPVLSCGAYYATGAGCGASYFDRSNASHSSSAIGARLLYKP